MPEIATDFSADLTAAVRPDGFIDFYELLGVPGDAAQDLINTRINDLYSRSQDNREHRHLAKRREAEVLLSLMPHCMDVLLDADNRAAYDAYAVSARAGAAPTNFETFMNDVIKESQAARTGLLGVRDEAPSQNVANSALSPVATTSASGAATNDAPVVTRARLKPRPISWGRVAAIFALVFVVSDLGFSAPPVVTLVFSTCAALVVAALMRRPVAPPLPANAQRVSA